jgi:hypothetical protein
MYWRYAHDPVILGCDGLHFLTRPFRDVPRSMVHLAAVLVVMVWWVHLPKFSGVGQGLRVWKSERFEGTSLVQWRNRKGFLPYSYVDSVAVAHFVFFHHFPRILMDPIFRQFNRRKLVSLILPCSFRSYSWCWAALTYWRRGKVAETETIRFSMWVCLI